MSHRGWVADERLDAPKGLGKGEDFHTAEQVSSALTGAELDADHSTKAGHLTLRQLVLRVRGKTGVIDAFGAKPLDKPARDTAARGVVLPHA